MKIRRRFELESHAVFNIFLLICVGLLGLLAARSARAADSAPFDLIGPGVHVTVTRGSKTLPISSVPNLQGGDRLWVHADLPSDQSAHYLLIVTFLQGPTNPPPENWFTRVETWSKQTRAEGTEVTVPQNAQQALLFLAPDTSGAFSTLRSTVRGKPGVFVRASQDLEQASLDRTRLDKFMGAIRNGSDSTPLVQRATLLSQTLELKTDPQCFERPVEQQSSCLTQDTDHIVLEETHNQSMVASLTTGASADLVGTMSATPVAQGGYFSPYIGSMMDMVRLLNGLHTPELQYLPALALTSDDNLNLRLNSAPSFHNPKSVLVVGLPAVRSAVAPLLRAVDPRQVYCAQDSSFVFRVLGEPLAFSTDIAHDFVVRLQNKSGKVIDLPAVADAARGGFSVDTSRLQPDELNAPVIATLRGFWGFDPYDGPSFELRSARSTQWTVPSSDTKDILAGRDVTLHLQSSSAVCAEKVSALSAEGKDLKVVWKAVTPDELEVQLPLKNESAGAVKLQVRQYGLSKTDDVTVQTYSEAASFEGFTMNAGDRQGVLTGTRLDEVSSFELNGIHFEPVKLTRASHKDMLDLLAPDSAPTSALPTDRELVAHINLKDGRLLELQTVVEPPRPQVTLVSKSVKPGAAPSGIKLGNADELPQDGHLTFLLKTNVPDKFPRDEKIEVATADGSADVLLSLDNGGLILQDAQSVLAVLEPLKQLGPSAFGPLQFRPVDEKVGKGDWQPLAQLVRIPTLKEIRCPDAQDQPCVLSGSNLFLLDSVSANADFKDAVAVANGYADNTLNVPRPSGTLLYVKLRDDPSSTNAVALPVLPDNYRPN